MQPVRGEQNQSGSGVNLPFYFRSLTFAAVLSFSLLSPVVLRAQDKRSFDIGARAVTGVVLDPGGKPASGAVVLLKDSKTLQVRSYLTNEDGAYRFLGLSPNDQYELRAQRNGSSSSSKTLTQFDSRKEAKINLKLK